MGKTIQELQKEIEQIKVKEQKTLRDRIKKEYGLKIGDEVEYISRDRVNDYDYETTWSKGQITNFIERGSTLFLKVTSHFYEINLKDARLFNENDYTLRHSIWQRELDIEETFQLVVDKPKSTKGNFYSVYKVVKEIGHPVEYFYYNDHSKPQTTYEGEFHVTTAKY